MGAPDNGKRSTLELVQQLSLPLIGGVLVALVWANIDADGYHRFIDVSPFGDRHPLTLHFFANEILMVFFFGVAAKEITEACLPGGALNPPRKAVNPLLSTVGGVVGPIAVYVTMTALFSAPEIAKGWGIPTATDIALAWLVARLAFGARHPAVSFLLLLAVADDAIGLGIIAIFYPDPEHPVEPVWLLVVVLAMVTSYVLKRRRMIRFWPYVIFGGSLSWFALHEAHLHPALALVPIVPFMPNRGRDEGLFREHGRGFQDTLNEFEQFFKSPVDFGLFAFGLANAGVAFASVGPATWSVLLALLIGKTVGITGASLLARRLGFPLPQGMNVKTLMLASLTAALGLTVALFVAGVAFVDPTLQGAAKMGALLSAVAAPLVLVLAKITGVRRKEVVAAGESAAIINPSGRPSLRGREEVNEVDMDLGP
jgi:NhaA family Na+:H+ antiporter